MTSASRVIGRSCSIRATAAIAALFVGAPSAPPTNAADATGAPPPRQARIWIYRDYQPYVSLARPYVRFNGRAVGISDPGGAFYRNVPPGRYQITVDSSEHAANQFARATVVAGQEIFVEIDAWRHANCAIGSRSGTCAPTFYTLLRPPQVAVSAIANSTFHGGK